MTTRPTREHVEAHQKLTRAIGEALQHGSYIPCCGPCRRLFISDDEGEQRKAAQLCPRCPFQVACKQYATTYPEPSGVYGGLTEADRFPSKKEKAA